jgi:predicted transcriptional regulator YdeE
MYQSLFLLWEDIPLRRMFCMIVESKIIEKPAFRVVGITERIHFDPSIPPSQNSIAKLWARLTERMDEIPGKLGWRNFGLILQNPNLSPHEFDYTASVQINEDGAVPDGMVCLDVQAARYIVFTYRGPLDGIGEAIRHFWGLWLPNNACEYDGGIQTGKYEFEFYDQRYSNAGDPNAEIDLYFPIRDKSR